MPRLLGGASAAAAPLAQAARDGYRSRLASSAGDTVASAIRIGDPVSYDKAVRVVRQSGGGFESASEQEILDAKRSSTPRGVYLSQFGHGRGRIPEGARASVIARDERV